MHPVLARILTLLVALVLTVPARVPAFALENPKPREQNAWARFGIGAWKKVHVVTETLDEQGMVAATSITDNATILDDVQENGYSLHVDVTMEVAGKKFRAAPEKVDQGFFGEGKSEGKHPAFKNIGNTTVTVEERKIPVEIYEIQSNGNQQKNTTRIYYSDRVSPHILRKEITATDSTGNNLLSEFVEEVVSLEMPHKVIAGILPTAHIKSVRRHSKGSTVTFSLHADKVPGGIVASTSKELDLDGRVLRRSTLEVTDYGLGDDRIERRVYKKTKRARRAR